MKEQRKAVSTSVTAAIAIVLLIAGAGAGYFTGTSSAVPTTSTVTRTITTGGGTPTTVTTTVSASATTSPSQAALAQAECKAQGSNTCLTIYSTLDSEDWAEDLAPIFYTQFPWATGKVNFVGLSASQVQSRSISEFKAGTPQVDVIQVTQGIAAPIFQAGATQNYLSPVIQQLNYTKDAYDPQGGWTVVFLSIPTLQYNPTQMQKLNLPIPTQWSDLGNPVYKGHIGFQTATSLSATTGIFYALYNQMGNSSGQWTNLMKSIAANQPTITSSASATTNNVIAGKVALGIGLYNDYLAGVAQNGTNAIKYVLPAPAVYNPALVVMGAKAPHPQMAKLFIDWAISAAGQVAIAESGRACYQPLIASEFNLFPKLPTGQSALQNSYANPAILQNPGPWSDTFKAIFGA